MMRSVVAMLACLSVGVLHAAEINECDLLAAHPSDPDHVGLGVSSADVNTVTAIAACRAAIAEHPGEPRFHYQLGRALTYHADRNDEDGAEGFEHVKHSADMNYTQALFVLGLLHLRDGDICATEPLTKQAADQGLKSARITYVNAMLAGNYGACGVSATVDEMTSYLAGASSQVSGYYENMLLTDLKRRLAVLAPRGDEK